ncbi:hypothetical protein [Rosistilla oblonga]|uniref:hypothetical protein n=1 Tax=Rosistilla oblonga TaxID=2527990 RepID=UPI003A981C8E
MNVVHCPGCAQSLQLPENASPDMTLQCPHCGAVHQVDQFLPAAAEPEAAAAEPEVVFNEQAQEEFSQGEILADSDPEATEQDDQELELLSFDEDIEELPMIEIEEDGEEEELPSFEVEPVALDEMSVDASQSADDAADEALPMIDLGMGDDVEETPRFEAEPAAPGETSADEDADDAVPMIDLEMDDEAEQTPNFEAEPVAFGEVSDDDASQPIDVDAAATDDDEPLMIELETDDPAVAEAAADPVVVDSELDVEPIVAADDANEDEAVELPSIEFDAVDSDEPETDIEDEAATELVESEEPVSAESLAPESLTTESDDAEAPLGADQSESAVPLGFTEFDRESETEIADESEPTVDDMQPVAAVTPAAPKRSRVASLVMQIVCPECNDPVRMPESPAASDAMVRCPWCGQTNPLNRFADQLAPALQLVSPGTDSVDTAVAAVPSRESSNQWSAEDANVDVATAPRQDDAYATFDDSPMLASEGFDMSAHGLQPRPRRRQKPSIVKMLIQWFGGGVLGIGGALAILYFGFPEKFPKFLPFQPPVNRSSSTEGSDGEFVPRSAQLNNDFGGAGFVVENEDNELLESIELPAADAPAAEDESEAIVQATEAAPPVEPKRPPSFVEQRLEAAREALAMTVETDPESSEFTVNRNSLYRSMAELAEAVSDNPFSKHPKREAARLMAELAKTPALMKSLGGLAPYWLTSSRRTSDGIFLVAKLGGKTKAQSRPGYHSIQLARYIGESADAEPITLFGLLDDLLPYQDQTVMILAVIENNAADIKGDGSLLKLSSIQPL